MCFERNGLQAVRTPPESGSPLAAEGTHESFPKIAHLGYLFFGISVVSFTLEQLFYLSGTARFVPKWIPPGQMFWAVTTTIALTLTAIALLSGNITLLTSQLLTMM